jgi:DNA-binding NarL/FixJ family response regulator
MENNENPIRLLIAEDHPVFLDGLIANFRKYPDFRIAGQVANGAVFLGCIGKTEFDIALVDIAMPNLDGIEALKQARTLQPKIKIVIMTGHIEPEFLNLAVSYGAAGYVSKNDDFLNIVQTIRSAHRGTKTFSPAALKIAYEGMTAVSNPLEVLTTRELEVLGLVAKGIPSQKICDDLGIAMRTLVFHKQNIKEKLQAKSTAELIHIAHKHRLTD